MRTPPYVFGLIAAAGSSARFGGGVSKPFLKLGTKTILERTLDVFASSNFIKELVILLREEDLGQVTELNLKTVLKEKPFELVIGGATREDSVYRGLTYIKNLQNSKEEPFVAIHDAARCFLDSKLLDEAIEGAFKYQAVTLAIPIVDSLKRVKDYVVSESVPRENLWAVQTPQVFSLSLILEAHEKGRKEGRNAASTDDASLVEMIHKVQVIRGKATNFKVTTPDDYEIAKNIVASIEV